MKSKCNRPMKRRPRRAESAEGGFTLLETAVASMIMLVGLLSAAQLFAVAALFNHSSKQTTMATLLAHRKVEELLAQPLTSAMLQYGGSLTTDTQVTSGGTTTNFYEHYYVDPTTKAVSVVSGTSPYTYAVRWQISADPGSPAMAGMLVIAVHAESVQAGLVGVGNGSTGAAKEVTEITTIRTPPQ